MRSIPFAATVQATGGTEQTRMAQGEGREALSQTIRQMMIDILRQGPVSAKDISTLVGISEHDIFPHLEHIRKSLHHGPDRLLIEPARCKSCGFVFHKRSRFNKPGRCPICHRSFIDEPCFTIRSHQADDREP